MDAQFLFWCLVVVTSGSLLVTVFDIIVYKRVQDRLKNLELVVIDQHNKIEHCQEVAADADKKADTLMGTVWKVGKLFHNVYKD